MEAPLPANESQRLDALRLYRILDTLPEQAYDDLVLLASQICGTPISLISLVDEDRQWFKAKVGLDAVETHRSLAFCAHAILQPEEVLVVPDATQDERFSDNALVLGDPDIRFYAGAPLIAPGGMPLGTLCVIDRVPRDLSEGQRDALRALSRQVMAQLELRRHVDRLQEQQVELEQRQHELERSNRELDDFAYIASHDLKEPLRGIHNYAGFLLEDYGDVLDDDGQAKLQTLARLAQRMESLINSLLEYSRLGRVDLAMAETDLNAILVDVVDSLHIRLAEQGVEVRVPEPLPPVHCDGARIGEVFRNLITNAMKYNDGDQKWVEIGCETERDSADPAHAAGPVFYVRDNGIGIAEKHRGTVFKLFKRLHGRNKYGGGTGAGLCIVKKIVDQHDGAIWVESTPGEGTTFRFTLEPAMTDAVTDAMTDATSDAVSARAA